MSETIEDILQDAATTAEAAVPAKKERKPKATAEGATPAEPKAPKEPKVKLYVQWNEDGTPMVDENGVRVKGPVKMERPRKERPEGTGTRSRVLPSHEASTISWNEEKVAKYKGARGDFAAMRKEGQTIAEYVEAGGDKGFLRFYVRDGAATVTAYVPA